MKIPIFDVGALACGFYTGYCHGKGIAISDPKAYTLLASPTLALTSINAVMIGAAKYLNERALEAHLHAEKEPVKASGFIREHRTNAFHSYTPAERLQIITKLQKAREQLSVTKTTAKLAAATTLETAVGYAAGRLYSSHF